MGPTTISSFTLSIPQSQREDLRRRLAATRWPSRESVSDWSQGAPLAKVQALCDYWLTAYDWDKCEALLNSWEQFTTEFDGVSIYFIHVRSDHADALPMLMTHGWPGSVLEFRHVIGPLTDPVAHGGHAEDAFHLVIPALPGYAFSEAPREPGWDPARIARAWAVLMQRLGYQHWVAQGGDWGCNVTTELGMFEPQGLLAIHVNTFSFDVKQEVGPEPTEEEAESVRIQDAWQKDGDAYSQIQQTRPQTLGYGLADSPIGQAAWIYEKLHAWSDHRGSVEDLLPMDEMVDNIMLYWWSNVAASSARLYWEKTDNSALHITLPVGVSQFNDISRVPKQWASRYYKNIVHWNEVSRGGHFAAWEQPQLLCTELRECFRTIRATLRRGQ